MGRTQTKEKYIYSIGTSRDYDLVGYVIAENRNDAIQIAKDKEMVTVDMNRYLRSNRVRYGKSVFSDKPALTEKEGYEKELRKTKFKSDKSYHIYKTMLESINEWKKLYK